MLREYRIKYHIAFHNGVAMIEADEHVDTMAADEEDAKESFKYYIKYDTGYKLPEVRITSITEL